MFILPYFYRKTVVRKTPLYRLSLLTLSGTQLWEEEDTLRIVEDILIPNGLIPAKEPRLVRGIYFCEIDPKKTNVDDYYGWDEIRPEEANQFCWRTHYVVGSVANSLLSPPSHTIAPFSYTEIIDRLSELVA